MNIEANWLPRLLLGRLPLGGLSRLPLPRLPLAAALAATFSVGCGGSNSENSAGADDAPAATEAPDADAVTAPTTASPTQPIDPALFPEGVTAEMVEEGRTLFAGGGICYTCHLADGTGGPLAPDLTDDVWINVDGEYASIVELVKTGVPQPKEHPGAMLPRAGMPLTDEQVAAVAAYSYLLSRTQPGS